MYMFAMVLQVMQWGNNGGIVTTSIAMGQHVLQRGDTDYSGTASIAMRQNNCYGANVCNVATRLATSSVYKKDQKVCNGTTSHKICNRAK